MKTEERKRVREAAQAGCVRAMHELAMNCRGRQEKVDWLRRAADGNYLPAVYAMAEECEDPCERLCWLRKAAGEGHLAAIEILERECADRSLRDRQSPEAATLQSTYRAGTGSDR